ncbi:MAG: hypothetical protein U9M98_00445 [Patescibacteria group bacterium]|nr:hypothetical protein [Patescibacteria group bacterium]
MGIFSSLTEKGLEFFFSTIGFRDVLIDDDSDILPYIEAALQHTPFADLKLGDKVLGRYYEHAVRFLGDNHIVKFVSPEPAELMRRWLDSLEKQKIILERYLPYSLPPFSYFYVPVEKEWNRRKGGSENLSSRSKSALATYALVMRRVNGNPLYKLSDCEIFSNQTVVKNLVRFLDGNKKMRKKQGLFADLIGGEGLHILNPRYTGNIYVTKEGGVELVDTVLIPPKYSPGIMPAKYRFAKLYHFCYRNFVLPRENSFYSRLKKEAIIN